MSSGVGVATDPVPDPHAARVTKEEVLQKVRDMLLGIDDPESMLLDEYESMLNNFKEFKSVGLGEAGCELGSDSDRVTLEGFIQRFEVAEGRRRVLRRRAREEQRRLYMAQTRMRLSNKLRDCTSQLRRIEDVRFTTARSDPALNGRIIESGPITARYTYVRTTLNTLIESEKRETADIADLNPRVDRLLGEMEELAADVEAEMQRRTKVDREACERMREQAKDEADVEEEELARAREEHLKRAAELREERAKRQKESEDKVQATREMGAKMRERRSSLMQIQREFEDQLQGLKAKRSRRRIQAEQEDEDWKHMMFATDEDRKEAEEERREELARRAEEQDQLDMKESEEERSLRMQITNVKADIEAEAIKISESEAEAKRLEAEIEREKLQDEAEFQRLVREMELKEQRKQAAVEARKQAIAAQHAALYGSAVDEEARRLEATVKIAKYTGDPWKAVRDNDLEMLQAFFLTVPEPSVLLEAHQKGISGGRTLLHEGAWWGCSEVVEYLLAMGADPNAIDTCTRKATPLIEAARAGHRTLCEFLLSQGADIRRQDCGGDTAVHWAARRGHAYLIGALLSVAERYNPGSTRGLISSANFKSKTPAELAKGPRTREAVYKAESAEYDKDAAIAQSASRVKRSVMRARMMGGSKRQLSAGGGGGGTPTAARSSGRGSLRSHPSVDADGFEEDVA